MKDELRLDTLVNHRLDPCKKDTFPMTSFVIDALDKSFVHNAYKVMSLKNRRIRDERLLQKIFFDDSSTVDVMGTLFKSSVETEKSICKIISARKNNFDKAFVLEGLSVLKKVEGSRDALHYGVWTESTIDAMNEDESSCETSGGQKIEKKFFFTNGTPNADSMISLFDSIIETMKVGYEKYKKMQFFFNQEAYKLEFKKVQYLVSILMSMNGSFNSLKFVFSDESAEAKFVKNATTFSIEYFYESENCVFVSAFKNDNLWAREYPKEEFAKIQEFVDAF